MKYEVAFDMKSYTTERKIAIIDVENEDDIKEAILHGDYDEQDNWEVDYELEDVLIIETKLVDDEK